MSVLIADSGSTKTDWALLAGGTVQRYKTEGLNPYFHSTESIKSVLRSGLRPSLREHAVECILFYGSGCDSPEKITGMEKALNQVFPGVRAEVHEDLLGAARACCFDQPGIVSILGTGSNSCRYDGTRIVQQIPSLGYILGDEGSAGFFGQQLLNRYYRDELPADLKTTLEQEYEMDLELIVEGIYHNEQSSRYVASFSSFLGENRGHPYVQSMLESGFREFIERIILKYESPEDYQIHFIGSLGHAYRGMISRLLTSYDLTPGKFIQRPMQRLIEFHTQ
ncbi:hypothetical protein ACG2F4_11635 [Halalkalibaculum sp. DA3122]|uniref:hypothetical protein n=1 Tax=unclassified Halalkalibaculum TaxID=2964617 RepID=UPI0037548BC3